MIRIGTDIDLNRFEQKLKRMETDVRQSSRRMKSESAGIGGAFSRGLAGLQSGLGQLGVGLGGVGAAAGLKAILTRADDFADLSLALNESAEALQRIDQVAQLTASIGVESLAKAFLRLEKNLGDAEFTDGAAALANLGVSAEELMAVPLEQKIMLLSDAFERARRDGTGVNDIMDLLGRSAGELIPMLAMGSAALKEMFSNVGPVMSDEDVNRMAALNDQFDQYIMKAKAGTASLLGQWLEGADLFAEIVSDALTGQNPFEGMDFREQSAASEAEDREAARVEQARRMQELQERATREAEQNRLKAETEKARERVDKARAGIDDARIADLPEDAKIAALSGKLETMLAEALAGTGLEGMPGLKFLARIPDADSGVIGRQAEVYEQLSAALEVEREIARLRADGAKEVATLREQVGKGALGLMSPEQQAARLRSDLSRSLGIDITGAADVERGLRDLQREAKDAAASGDLPRERAALERLRGAQQEAQQLAGLDVGGNPPARGGLPPQIGEVGRTINLLFGRAAGDSAELTESKTQTGLLRSMDKVLQSIDRTLATREDDIFTF